MATVNYLFFKISYFEFNRILENHTGLEQLKGE